MSRRDASLSSGPARLDPVLLSVEAPPAAFDPARGPWHVLHSKSRQEKALSADLAALGIAHYLPLIKQIKYYGPRKATVEVPLFSGYVFLRGSLDDAYAADRTRRVAGIIRVADQRQLEWELTNLHFALKSGRPLAPYPFLKKGLRVEVKSGPLRGLQGIIEDLVGASRVILQVEMLGRAVSLEIEGALVEPLA